MKHDAYGMQPTIEALTQQYEGLQKSLLSLVAANGLGMAVYTQITDVEHEVNGFLTYDRKVEKMDFGRMRHGQSGSHTGRRTAESRGRIRSEALNRDH